MKGISKKDEDARIKLNEAEIKLFCQYLITDTEFSNEFIKYFHYKLLHSQWYLSTSFETRKKLAHDISQKFPFVDPAGKIIFDEIISDELILKDYCDHILKGSLKITKSEVKTLHAKLHNSRSQDFDIHCLHHKLAFTLYEKSSFLKEEYPFPTIFFKVATDHNIKKLQSFIDEIYSYWETLYDTLECQKKSDLAKLGAYPELYHLIQKRIDQDLQKHDLEFYKNILDPLNFIVLDATTGLKNNDNLTNWLNNQNFKKDLNRYKERRKMQQILLKHYQMFNKVKASIIQKGELSSASLNQKILDELKRLTKNYYNTDETGQPYIKLESTYSQIGIVLNQEQEAPSEQKSLEISPEDYIQKNQTINPSHNKKTNNELSNSDVSVEEKAAENIQYSTPSLSDSNNAL